MSSYILILLPLSHIAGKQVQWFLKEKKHLYLSYHSINDCYYENIHKIRLGLRHATHSYWLSWTGLNSHTKIFVICCSCRLRAHWNTRPCTTCGRKNTLKRTKISKRVRSSHLASNYKFPLTQHLSSIFWHGSSFVQGFKLVW